MCIREQVDGVQGLVSLLASMTGGKQREWSSLKFRQLIQTEKVESD